MKQQFKRLTELEKEFNQPGQVETLLKVIPGGAEFYKVEAGHNIRIEQAEYNQHITKQIKAGQINIEVILPEVNNEATT